MQMPDGLNDLYQEVILDHYRRPRRRGALDNPDLRSEGFNPFCGDQVILTLALGGDGSISDVAFQGEGCSISQASASMLVDRLSGMTLDEAEAMVRTFKDVMQGAELSEQEEEALGEILALQGVREFPIRVKCALLGWTTLQDAIAEYRQAR